MSAKLWDAASVNAFSTTLDGSIISTDETITLTSVTGLSYPGIVVVDRIDGGGNNTEDLREYISYTGITGSQLTGCTRGLASSTAQAHSSGAIVEEVLSVTHWNDLVSFLEAEHTSDGTHDSTVIATLTAEQTLTNKTLTSPTITTGTFTGEQEFGDDIDIADGKNVKYNNADPNRTITLMPGFLKPTTTAGCADSATVEAGTNDIDYDVLDFSTSTDEHAYANFQMPDSWNAGAIQFRYIWTNAGGGAAETVNFNLKGRSFANDDAIDQANGTGVAVADTWIAQGDIHISAWSTDVTLAGTPAAGEYVHIDIMRDVSEDDLTGDARLMAVQIRYKQATLGD